MELHIRNGRVCVLTIVVVLRGMFFTLHSYKDAGKSLAQPGRKQATATEDFDVHISYLLSQLEEY